MKRSLLFLGFALGLLSACAHHDSSSTGTAVGMKPVSFTLPRLGGGHDALDAHHGHLVLLDLWASWCPPCREELPVLSKLATSQSQIVVLAANQGESAAVVEQVVRSQHIQMPILLDRDQAYGGAYATIGLPTAVILDRNGNIAAIEAGAHTEEEWRAIMAPLEKTSSGVTH